jgi:hypothetical protein
MEGWNFINGGWVGVGSTPFVEIIRGRGAIVPVITLFAILSVLPASTC